MAQGFGPPTRFDPKTSSTSSRRSSGAASTRTSGDPFAPYVPSLVAPPKPHPIPDRAPYRHGRSPEQLRATRVRAQGSPTLFPGQQVDPRVQQIQHHLNALGYHVQEDGIMGPETRAAMFVSHNGTVRNVVHNPGHSKAMAEQHVTTAKPRVVRQYKPFVEGQQPSGYTGAFKNLDGSIALPGTKPQPGARITNVPYYEDPSQGLTPDSALSLEMPRQTQQDIADSLKIASPAAQAVVGGIASALPGVATARRMAAGENPSVGSVGTDLFNGALLFSPSHLIAPALRGTRAAVDALQSEGVTRAALRAIRIARGSSRAAAEDAASFKRAQAAAKTAQRLEGPVQSPVKDQLEQALRAAPHVKNVKQILTMNDVAARAVATEAGVTPERAYEMMWNGAQFHDVVPTAEAVKSGQFSQSQIMHQGSNDEITNLAHVPEAVHQPDPGVLTRASRSLLRSAKTVAPEAHSTPKKLEGLLQDLQRRAIDAADYKDWYANSAAGILQHTGGDVGEADKIAALIAVYSPRAEVYSKGTEWNNLDRAINAYNEFRQSGEISPRWSISSHKVGEGDWQTTRATQIMRGDFSWNGLKTNRFYRNFLQHIDPEKYRALFGEEKFGTMDTWMRRAFRYDKAGGRNSESISPKMYTFMERATKAVADSLGWTPDEAQAAIWTTVKAEAEGTPLSQAGFDFRDAFAHRNAREYAKTFREASPEEGAAAIQQAYEENGRAWNLTPHSPEELQGSRVFLSEDGRAGYLISPEGDLQNVFNNSGHAGVTGKALEQAVNNGARTLDAYDGFLPKYYERYGFRETGRMKFNPEYAPDGMPQSEIDKAPDVVFMSHAPDLPTGKTSRYFEDWDAAKQESQRVAAGTKDAQTYSTLLANTRRLLGGKVPLTNRLTPAAIKDTEDFLFEWAHKNADKPEAKQFMELYQRFSDARNSPNPETFFQKDNPLLHSIAAAQGRSLTESELHAISEQRDLHKGDVPPEDWPAFKAIEKYRNRPGKSSENRTPAEVIDKMEDEGKLSQAQGFRLETLYAHDAFWRDPPQVLEQPGRTIKGAVERNEQGQHFLHLFRGADVSTAVHELGHALEPYLPEADRAVLRSAAEASGSNSYDEFVARSFERYFADGKAPSKELKGAFSKLAKRVVDVYGRAEAIPGSAMNDEIRTVFNRAFLREAQLDPAWARRTVAAWHTQPDEHTGDLWDKAGGPSLHDEFMADARAWLGDNAWSNMEPEDFYDLPDAKITKAIDRYYHGGVDQFIRDGQYSHDVPTATPQRDIATLTKGDRALLDDIRNAQPNDFLTQEDHVDPALEAAAMQVKQGGMSIEDAAKMFGQDPEALRAHIEGGGHAAEQQRILSNADVGAGPAETTRSAEDYLQGTSQDDSLATTREPTPAGSYEEQVQRGMAGARSQRGVQEGMYSEERSRRARQVERVFSESPGFEGYVRAMGELRGELPKIHFGGFEELTPEALDHLFAHIQGHEVLTPFQKIRAQRALLMAVEGRVPTKSEITLLENVFGKQTVAGLKTIPTKSAKIKNSLLELLNVPRSLMASFDLSAPFRQGLVVGARHPKLFFGNFSKMVRAFGSENVYRGIMDDIVSRDTYPMMQKAKLSLTEAHGELSTREEQFFGGNYAERIPVVGRGVKASERAYVAFLDKTRADVFDHLIRVAHGGGINVQDEKFLKDLGRYVNSATGRGTFNSETLENSMPFLNTMLFSPRLLASRVNFLNPHFYVTLDPFVRKEALRSALQLTGAVSTVLSLAALGGATVVMDPRNADFAKIKLGNTRFDILGGFQQPIRLTAQLVTGKAISSTTGDPLTLGPEGPGKLSRKDIVQRFFEGKLAPVPGMVNDWLKGTNFQGQKFSTKQELMGHFIPLLAQDAASLYHDQHGGMNGVAYALAGYGIGSVGFGIQNYANANKASSSKNEAKLEKQAKAAGVAPPSKNILIAVDHKTKLDSITGQHKGDPLGRLKESIKYYQQVTGRHDLDAAYANAKRVPSLADTYLGIIRTVLIGAALPAYESAVKTAGDAKKLAAGSGG